MFAQSFPAVTPPPIFGNLPAWTSIHVEEATSATGAFVEIDVQSITPDTTPDTPATIPVTTQSATLANGWYRFRFATTAGVLSAYTRPVHAPVESLTITYAPTVPDLAKLIPGRATGKFAGGTTPPTFPDTDRVQGILDMAVGLVAPRLGSNTLPDKFHPLGKSLILLRAAMLLEPAAWPEQARPDKSAYEQWREQFDDDLAALLLVIKADAEDGDQGDGGPEAAANLPVFSFPNTDVFDPQFPFTSRVI